MPAKGWVDVDIEVQDESVDFLLFKLDTALNPVAIAGFLGAQVDPYLRGRARDRFREEGDDVSGAWAPLKEVTQVIRSQQGYGSSHPINRRTGQLEEFITGAPNRLTVHNLGATLTLPGRQPVGELKRKVETAQKGRNEPPRTVARPVLGMNERDLTFVLTMLAFHVTGVK